MWRRKPRWDERRDRVTSGAVVAINSIEEA
jgi:hypothetical protein